MARVPFLGLRRQPDLHGGRNVQLVSFLTLDGRILGRKGGSMTLSGSIWVSKFPNSRKVSDLEQPFKTNVERFLAALKNSGATVVIADTLRPAERAYLMHFSFAI